MGEDALVFPPPQYPKSILLVAANLYLAELKTPFDVAVAVSFAYSILWISDVLAG